MSTHKSRRFIASKIECASEIYIDEDLPAEYLYAIRKLLYRLNKFLEVQLILLGTWLPASPPLRARFFRAHPAGQPEGTLGILEEYVEEDDERKQMLLVLRELRTGADVFTYAGANMIVDGFERLPAVHPSLKSLLSNFVAAILGDGAILTQSLHQFDTYQLWASTFDGTISTEDEVQISQQCRNHTRALQAVHDISRMSTNEEDFDSAIQETSVSPAHLINDRQSRMSS